MFFSKKKLNYSVCTFIFELGIVMLLFIYNFLFALFLPLIVLFKWIKFCKRLGIKSQFSQFFSLYSQADKASLRALPDETIWVHAVSVGEAQVALSFIRAYLAHQPQRHFLLTTTTPTGQAIAKKQAPNQTIVMYAPLDFSLFLKRFTSLFKCQKLIVMETELWPNLISVVAQKNVEIYLVNGRLSDHSSKGYIRFKKIFYPLLRKIKKIGVQTELDFNRFKAIGQALNVEVIGNLKFDQKIPENLLARDLSAYWHVDRAKVLLAASTHPREELYILEHFSVLKAEFAHLKLVIVPRHAERGNEIESQIKHMNFPYARVSTNYRTQTPEVEVLLADTTGELLQYIKAADIVLVGKTFAGYTESQNPIEGALLKKPLYSGMQMTNFRFVFDELIAHNAIQRVESDLSAALAWGLRNENELSKQAQRAYEVLTKHQGATEKSVKMVEETV